MPTVFLVHWKSEEIPERAQRLRAAGYEVESDEDHRYFRRLLNSMVPDAVVIDLGRLPSHGRDIAGWFRETRATRCVPLVFVDGEEAKVIRTRDLFPDAVFTTWPRIRSALQTAIANPPTSAIPIDRMSGYSKTPLAKKLGIKSGTVVSVVNGPPDFHEIIGELPESARLRHSMRGRFDLLIWRPASLRDLEAKIGRMADRTPSDGMWILWPKQASGVPTDLTQNVIREIAMACGLVDYKICSVNDVYSGLKFAVRRRPAD